jgi:type II secretory pathway component PulM
MTFKRRWHITLFRTDSSKTISIGLPTRIEWALIAVSAFVLIIVIYVLFWVAIGKADARKIHELEAQNKALQEHITELQPQLDSVRVKIQQMARWQDSLDTRRSKPVLNTGDATKGR